MNMDNYRDEVRIAVLTALGILDHAPLQSPDALDRGIARLASELLSPSERATFFLAYTSQTDWEDVSDQLRERFHRDIDVATVRRYANNALNKITKRVRDAGYTAPEFNQLPYSSDHPPHAVGLAEQTPSPSFVVTDHGDRLEIEIASPGLKYNNAQILASNDRLTVFFPIEHKTASGVVLYPLHRDIVAPAAIDNSAITQKWDGNKLVISAPYSSQKPIANRGSPHRDNN